MIGCPSRSAPSATGRDRRLQVRPRQLHLPPVGDDRVSQVGRVDDRRLFFGLQRVREHRQRGREIARPRCPDRRAFHQAHDKGAARGDKVRSTPSTHGQRVGDRNRCRTAVRLSGTEQHGSASEHCINCVRIRKQDGDRCRTTPRSVYRMGFARRDQRSSSSFDAVAESAYSAYIDHCGDCSCLHPATGRAVPTRDIPMPFLVVIPEPDVEADRVRLSNLRDPIFVLRQRAADGCGIPARWLLAGTVISTCR